MLSGKVLGCVLALTDLADSGALASGLHRGTAMMVVPYVSGGLPLEVGALRLPHCGVVTEVDATGLQLHEPCCRREVLLGVGRGIVLGNGVGCLEVFVFGL